MATKQEKWQEIANRGLEGNFDQETRVRFDEAVNRGLITLPVTEQKEPALTNEGFTALGDFIPTDEALALNQQAQDKKPDPTLAENIVGLGDAALTLTSAATGGLFGMTGGTIEGAIGELTGDLERGQGQELATSRASALTRDPKTEQGAKFVKSISEILGVLPPALGAAPGASLRSASRYLKNTATKVKATARNSVPVIKELIPDKIINSKVLSSRRARQSLLVDELVSGNPNIKNIGKALNDVGEVVSRPASLKAVKVLGGTDEAKGLVSVIEKMSPATKKQSNKMLDFIEKGKNDVIFKDMNRVTDIVGGSGAERARAIKFLNKKSGEEIGNVAKSLDNKTVNISRPKEDFIRGLNDLGVTFKRGDDGWVTPDFSRSKFQGGNQNDMAVLINDLLNDNPNFEFAHKLKQQIRKNVDFDKGGAGQIKGQSQKMLKDLSRGIDDILDSTSPKYKKANENFANTVELKNNWEKLSGKDIDINGNVIDDPLMTNMDWNSDLFAEALGGKLMRLISNAESRTPIKQLLVNTERALKKLNVKFKDDVPQLIHVASEFDDIFKLTAKGSAKGIINKAVNAAETATSPVGMVRKGIDVVSDIKNKPKDFNKKLRAIRALTKQGKK